jgi:hypothetical protein
MSFSEKNLVLVEHKEKHSHYLTKGFHQKCARPEERAAFAPKSEQRSPAPGETASHLAFSVAPL